MKGSKRNDRKRERSEGKKDDIVGNEKIMKKKNWLVSFSNKNNKTETATEESETYTLTLNFF